MYAVQSIMNARSWFRACLEELKYYTLVKSFHL
uniref:Uncharacterized protein n=1 Tax=Arundo donax TaxID=35708 RepID=A0A0A9C173_ARUDO